jgi:hypothetical protein
MGSLRSDGELAARLGRASGMRVVPDMCPSCYLASGPGKHRGTIHFPVTFPWLDIRCAMAQSYRIVISE